MKVMLFALAGVAAGIGIGMLLAPASGSETRRKLRYSTNDLKKRLGLHADEFSDSELEMDAVNGRSFGV